MVVPGEGPAVKDVGRAPGIVVMSTTGILPVDTVVVPGVRPGM